MVAAPAISSCSQGTDQPFLSCVVGKIFNRGSDGSQVSSVDDALKTEDGGSENAPAAATETSQTAALNDQASPPVAQNDIAVVVPEFTIARATADGLVVIVGTAAVGDTVIVKSNGQILGKTKPERTGEWVFVPENPLATGGVEITVEAQDAKGNFTPSAKSEIVLIHEGRDQEPIVVASVLGEASSIIQGLEPKVVGV